MTPQEENWLALTLVEGLGQKTMLALLSRFGNIEALLKASPEEIIRSSGIKQELGRRINQAKEVTAYQIEKRLVQEQGIGLTLLDQENYPALLEEISVPPPLIYHKGEFPITEGLHLAVVGTRKYTRYGESVTRRLIIELAAMVPELVIVSGLARGIDTVAHQQALECGLKTIAVMAGGLNNVYPPENQELAARIVKQGAMITEFPLTASPLPQNFPIRNRIISGLSAGILIVEAGEKSGALITAGFGLNHNREVFAVPGAIDSPTSVGTNRLIQKGQAKMVREAGDILEEFSPFKRLEPKQMELLGPEQKITLRGQIPLSEEKTRVLEALRRGPLHPDDLSQETLLPIEKLLGILLELELAGEILNTEENQYAIS